MSQRIAEEDITTVNGLGQTVVLVPKGQPIPEGFDSAGTGLRSAEPATAGASDGQSTTPPPAGATIDVAQFGEALPGLDDEVFAELGEVFADEAQDRGGLLPTDLPDGVIAGETPGWPTDDQDNLLRLPAAERWKAIAAALSETTTELKETKEQLVAAEKRAEEAEAAAKKASKSTSKQSKDKKA